MTDLRPTWRGLVAVIAAVLIAGVLVWLGVNAGALVDLIDELN